MENEQLFRRSLARQPHAATTPYYDFPATTNYLPAPDLPSNARPVGSPTGSQPDLLANFLRNQSNSLSKDSRFSLVDTAPKPFLELREAKLVEGSQAISISDRLRQQPRPNDSLFSTRRRLLEADYVFNSGPLVEDRGDSDYEDYFGGTERGTVQDEEIRLVGRGESFHLSKLLSPKDQSAHSLLPEKEKSSVIVDLSESFSKRDFEVSKDEETINLSELKLSKLEKRREEEKHRLREAELSQEKRSFVSDSNIDSKNNSSKVNSSKIAAALEKHSKVSEDTPPPPSDFLKDFTRPTPLTQDRFHFQPPPSSKLPERVTLLSGKEQVRGVENSLGVLNEFLRKEVQSKGKGREGTSELERFFK